MKMTVHLGLYSQKSMRIMSKMLEVLDKFWDSRQMSRNLDCCLVVEEPDGETCFIVDSERIYSYSFSKTVFSKKCKSIQDIKDWIAYVLKICVRHYDTSSAGWNRSNTAKLSVFSDGKITVTVADCYFVYDFLKCRKNIESKYPSELQDDIVGHPRDAVQTELEITLRDETKKIEIEYAEKVRKLRNTRYERIKEAEAKIEKEISEEIAGVTTERDQKIHALKEKLGIIG